MTGVKLIDGRGGPAVDGATVLVDGERIRAAGPGDSVRIPDGTVNIDGRGMTLLPGLIDCHDHLASFGYDLAGRWGLTERASQRHLRIASVLKQTLETGYTTVRDAGGLDAGFREAVNEGLVPGPRLQVALGIISPTGAMADYRSPSGHERPGGYNPSLPSGVADGPDGMRAKVREMVRAGADVIKLATTGGASSREGLGPKDMFITREEVEAVVSEAHRLGRRVMCHALGGPGLRAAVESGVDSIEHGAYLDEDPDLLRLMAERDISFIPTSSVYVYHGQRGTPHGKTRTMALRDNHVRSLLAAMEAGIRVVAGTDAGGWVHGNNAQEISCLVEAGMTPDQAIVAATGDAARCLGIDSSLGTIEAGKTADLVLLEGDPLSDVSLLEEGRAVRLVVKDGEVVVDRRTTA